MIKDKDYWRNKKREQRAKLKAGKAKEKAVAEVLAPVTVESEQWDKEKYPVREAWEIAVVRADRARKYAAMFPHMIGPSDMEFQDVEWQYAFEGLPAVEKRGHVA